MNPEFYEIDNILVNSEVISTNFTCDLGKCKGACCTMESEFGAPITEQEVEKIESILPEVLGYLPEKHSKEIKKKGFWVKKHDQLMTRSINNRECVFVYYDGDIAKCGIEKAYNDGKVDFIKPVSCHLFPIRISEFGGPVLRYEKYSECQPAVENGKKTKIKILEFCRHALERRFGADWFNRIKEAAGI